MNESVIKAKPYWRSTIDCHWGMMAGAMMLFLPSLFTLFGGIWATEGYAHGPIILLLSLWLLHRQWPLMLAESASRTSEHSGWLCLSFGLLLYILGRSQGILMAEIGSFIVILVAWLLLNFGWKAVKVQWFPIFFMLFMVPLPGLFVDAMTLPMKMAVSYVTEHVLFMVGYPIARTGVILQIGQYQLMVADACAGLQTLLTLESLGLFYLNVVRHTATLRNVVLAILIIPISFTANVIRVITLTLITYHFGDAAGQGFLHGFAGMVLFISALLLIISVDSLLQYAVKMRQNPEDRMFRN